MSVSVTRTNEGFVLSARSTFIVSFGIFDGEPAAFVHELGDPYNTIFTTDHPRGLWYVIYHNIRHASRWKAENE